MMFGGDAGSGESIFNDIHYFHFGNFSWTNLSRNQGPTPPARFYCAFATLGSKFYVYGGAGDGGAADGQSVLSDLWSFDLGAAFLYFFCKFGC